MALKKGDSALEVLSPPNRVLLYALATAYEPLSIEELTACLRHLPPRLAMHLKLGRRDLEKQLKDLAQHQLLVLGDDTVQCPPDFSYPLVRELLDAGEFNLYATAVRFAVSVYYSRLRSFEQGIRELRLNLLATPPRSIESVLNYLHNSFDLSAEKHHPLILAIPDQEHLLDVAAELPAELSESVLHIIWTLRAERMAHLAPFAAALSTRYAKFPNNVALRDTLAHVTLIQGNIPETKRLLAGVVSPRAARTLAWADMLVGDYSSAVKLADMQVHFTRPNAQIPEFFTHEASVYCLLALVIAQPKTPLTSLIAALQQSGNRAVSLSAGTIEWVGMWRIAGLRAVLVGAASEPFIDLPYWTKEVGLPLASDAPDAWRIPDVLKVSPLADLLTLLLRYACEHPMDRSLDSIQALAQCAEDRGYRWIAFQLYSLLAQLDPSRPTWAKQATSLNISPPFVSLASLFVPTPAWVRQLSGLKELLSEESTLPPLPSSTRLAWFLTWKGPHDLGIEAKEQKLTAKGKWSAGSRLTLLPLYIDREKPDNKYSFVDRTVLQALRRDTTGPYYNSTYISEHQLTWDLPKALEALSEHPAVFWNDASRAAVKVVKSPPVLTLFEELDTLVLRLSPPLPSADASLVLERSSGVLTYTVFRDEHRVLSQQLGPKGIRVPRDGRDKMLELLPSLSSRYGIETDIAEAHANLTQIEADSTIVVQLVPIKEGLNGFLRVRPLGPKGPALMPAEGRQRVVGTRMLEPDAENPGPPVEEKVCAVRAFDEERQRLDAVLERCPTLSANMNAPTELNLASPVECLETLSELRELGEEVRLEWPEGEKFRLTKTFSASSLRVSAMGADGWLKVNGSLTVDDGLVLDMQSLIGLLEGSPGRFLPLNDGRYLAITERFRQQLLGLESLSVAKGGARQASDYALPLLGELLADVGELKIDKLWTEKMDRLKAASTLELSVPPGLKAELRPYQVEGFLWLARLAHWGAGACLADDMGLGKTVQTLALLLHRAAGGPALVIAPTSVCPNWISETERFAPDLKVILFGSGERQRALAEVGPGCLVVASYGLLVQESELFQGVTWHTVVLDEAQAVKNDATLRAQAAQGLKADFRVATTGTPVENHVGELWSLFRFLNPGLLGSREAFGRRFLQPIERAKSAEAQQRLKRLIQPFILRRTKDVVLKELPPRTEIVHRVQPDAVELAFYEALRRKAVEVLESEVPVPPEQRRFKILAAITRLRRAACNPQLISPDAPASSAKLDAFLELVTELRSNGHRALVFSQFVDHLSLLRKALDAQEISYQYLDGSTPMSDRKRRVDAFQAGEGDLFLISLRAGGFGLNLTGADYVLHMDPWWNPAVEDQASDRAHRIGQTRPVTVYRVVMAGSIEEKILALHESKRDLADQLLEGTEAPVQLSEQDLLELLKEG